jgi:hypothetical protein
MGNYLLSFATQSIDDDEEGGDRSENRLFLQSKLHKSISQHLDDPSELNQYVQLYSSPEQIHNFFFDTYSLANRLRDDYTGEIQPLKVKLICIDLEGWQDRKILGFIAANLYSYAGFLDWGLVHTGIQLGSWILHWFNDSLVHFTTTKATRPNCAVDVGSLQLDNESHVQRIHDMCRVIAKYNMEMQYNNTTNNCHKFTNDLLSALGFSQPKFEGQLGDYMNKLKNGPVQSKLFIDPLTREVHDLSNHVTLDMYCINLFDRYGGVHEFIRQYPHDYALLKAWDRAYWLGNLKDRFMKIPRNRMNINYIPMYITINDEGVEECHCPFGDPTESGSMIL